MRAIYLGAFMAFSLAAAPNLHADFSYQETTQITGGAIIGMVKMASVFSSKARQVDKPIVTSIYLKGNRMARVSEFDTEIVDLDAGTMTHIDHLKHTYTIMTFEQMKEQMASAADAMKKQQAQEQANAQPESSAKSDVQVSFDVHVRATGASKQVSGVDANEAILTLVMKATDPSSAQSGTMGITDDMWIAPQIPGYEEMQEFNKRLGEKMGDVFSSSRADFSKILNQQPGAADALKRLAEEMQQVKGVPVLQISRMGMTTNGQPLPAASEAPLPPSPPSPQTPTAGQIAGAAISDRLSSFGLGGFGHKKKAQPTPPATASSPDGQTPTAAVLMESRTETSGFSDAPVDQSHYAIPAGYQQVPMNVP